MYERYEVRTYGKAEYAVWDKKREDFVRNEDDRVLTRDTLESALHLKFHIEERR